MLEPTASRQYAAENSSGAHEISKIYIT